MKFLASCYLLLFLMSLTGCGLVDEDLENKKKHAAFTVTASFDEAGRTAIASGEKVPMTVLLLASGQPFANQVIQVQVDAGSLEPASGKLLSDSQGKLHFIYKAQPAAGNSTPVSGVVMFTLYPWQPPKQQSSGGYGGGSSSDTHDPAIDAHFFIDVLPPGSSTGNTDAEVLPDTDSFAFYIPSTISGLANPANIEANNNALGETVTLVVQLGTQANVAVADNTTVDFYTEAGTVDAHCQTSGGKCTVTWTASQPFASDGRGSLLAVTRGVESFQDNNGNQVFDNGDTLIDSLGEPFLDMNGDNFFEAGEFFLDDNANGVRDAADGKYSGPNCLHATLCSGMTSITLFASQTVLLSGATAKVASLVRTDTSTAISAIQEGVPVEITLCDSIGIPLGEGTKIDFTTTNGNFDFSFNKNPTMPSSRQCLRIPLTLGNDFSTGKSGQLKIRTTAPVSGIITDLAIPVNDVP